MNIIILLSSISVTIVSRAKSNSGPLFINSILYEIGLFSKLFYLFYYMCINWNILYLVLKLLCYFIITHHLILLLGIWTEQFYDEKLELGSYCYEYSPVYLSISTIICLFFYYQYLQVGYLVQKFVKISDIFIFFILFVLVILLGLKQLFLNMNIIILLSSIIVTIVSKAKSNSGPLFINSILYEIGLFSKIFYLFYYMCINWNILYLVLKL
eukprot:426595_1